MDPNLDLYIGKLLLYARQYNASKFLKYLQFVRRQKSKGTISSNNSQPVEVILRKKGALQAIVLAFQTIIVDDKDETSVTTTSQERSKVSASDESYTDQTRNSIVREGLCILGNAFAIDAESRTEAFKYGFISILQRLMAHPSLLFNDSIQTRVLKCLGNICASSTRFQTRDESSCRRQILRSGIVTSVFSVIHNIKKIPMKLENKNAIGVMEESTVIKPIPKEKAELLCAAVRAIRILAMDPETQAHLCRLDGLLIVGDILVWSHFKLTNELIAEILKALTVLSERLRSARHEVVFQLKTEGEPFLKDIVRLFKISESDEKLTLLIITCLVNFAKNKDVVSIFRLERIFNIIFNRIEITSENSMLEQLVKLLRELVTQDSTFHSYLLPHSSNVGSTLKILRSRKLSDYHCFLLNFYENLHGSSIPDLTSLGLIDLLQELLRETYKDCTYESLRDLICLADSDICSSHSRMMGQCPFVPVYRCTSPGYLQAQKEVKEYLTARTNLTCETEVWAPSPLNSWSSYNMSDEDTIGGQFSPSSTLISYSPVSSTVGSDDDEGVGGESNIFPDVLFEFSDGEDVNTDIDIDRSHHEKIYKRRKLDLNTPSSFSTSLVEPQEISTVTSKDQLIKIKKVAAIIGILKKLMHIDPFKPELLQFVPTLLALLCDGKLSCMNYETCVDNSSVKDETISLKMRCFYGSDSILREFFSKIGNFQSLLESEIIPLINRLTLLGKENEDLNDELKKCNSILERLLPILAGEEDKTSGWRKGFLMQSLLSTSNPLLKQQAGLSIPLLYEIDGYYLREFEQKGHAWSELFNTLGSVDEISNSLFQDTIISLAALCKTFGMKWTEQDEYLKKKQLVIYNSNDSKFIDTAEYEKSVKVLLELDDGECISVRKESLTNASPVFVAMFDGHFLETEEQRVKLPNTSKKSLQALIHQILANEIITIDQFDPSFHTTISKTYDLVTIFELISLSNHFLLTDIHEKTFNSIIASYICPYSAPSIYEQAIQMSPHEKPKDVKWTGQFNFSTLVLKYLLVGSEISCGLRCSAFKKIFDTVEPFIVIRDLKCIFEHYAKSIVTVTPTTRRRKSNNVNIMLKI